MGNPKAFLTIHRQEAGYRPVHERIDDFSEVEQTLNSSDRRTQASRCMDCGVPFCHWACPLGNKQPEWQDLLYKGRWREAFHVLEQTCDFPEFTGRICPALCEKSCVLKLSCDEPVTIRENEASIVEAAFREGYIQPVRPIRNGKRVAVIGRPGRTDSSQPTEPPGIRSNGIREIRTPRRPAPIRYSELQIREEHHRPPYPADGTGRDRLQSQHDGRQ